MQIKQQDKFYYAPEKRRYLPWRKVKKSSIATGERYLKQIREILK